MTDPVKEDRTIYDAFNAGEARNAAGAGGDGAKQRGTHSHSQPTNKKRKPEQNGKRETVAKPVALDTALAQVLSSSSLSVSLALFHFFTIFSCSFCAAPNFWL